jgi:hypothetical protein
MKPRTPTLDKKATDATAQEVRAATILPEPKADLIPELLAKRLVLP